MTQDVTTTYTGDVVQELILPQAGASALYPLPVHSREARHIEKATKSFYERFKDERKQFVNGIQGISQAADRERYASLMLNRLMFLYFIQQKGFLDGDTQYLVHRLHLTQKQHGYDTFYRFFLLPLFFEGLGSPAHSPELRISLGNIPYLDGDLFALHEIEQRYLSIHIADKSFKRIFAFFNAYRWHLDEAPLQQDNELHSGILGYIFEKYINQQQMGAYYTKIDITGYIAHNTIIPHLFDRLEQLYPALFGGGGTIWRLLQQQPDRYIYAPVRDKGYLPGETTREYLARRTRYTELTEQMIAGRLNSIDDFITHNLDLCLFTLDVIQHIEEAEHLNVFYEQLQQITILDPTCGSGAFLFAALNVLEVLYMACLSRLKSRSHASSAQYHTLNRYAILKTIITHNLYGVDIMAEAAEICKLRLFLKLIAQIERVEDIEPLPHIEHNIRVGNTLVGFITGDDDSSVDRDTLDRRLARQYHVVAEDNAAFVQWHATHQPFHWNIEFSDILKEGGFHVIIGNPPYVEYSHKNFTYQLSDFSTLACANLYTCVIERSHRLLAPGGRNGMILPLAAFATRNMIPFIEGFLRWFPCSWLSFYHFRPSMLFSGGKIASIPTAIYLAKTVGQEKRFSTHVAKWSVEHRHLLFPLLTYCQVTVPRDPDNRHYYPKFGNVRENSIMEKVQRQQKVSTYLAETSHKNIMYYRSAGGLYWKVFVNFAWPYHTTSNKQCAFQDDYDRDVFVALFNSSLFWWYYTTTFDTFNLKDYMIFGFRFTYPEDPAMLHLLKTYCQQLMDDFRHNARHLKRGKTDSYTIYAKKAKPIIDNIDRLLAQHYQFTNEELDFILHYDVKHRMGLQGDAEFPERST
jgi:hypothetical protein